MQYFQSHCSCVILKPYWLELEALCSWSICCCFTFAYTARKGFGEKHNHGTHRFMFTGEYPWGNKSFKCVIPQISNQYILGINNPCKLRGFRVLINQMFGELDLLSVSHVIYVLSIISEPINASSKVLAKLSNTTAVCSVHSEL